MTARLMVGTKKGGYVFRSDDDRKSWTLEQRIFPGWEVTAVSRTSDGEYLCGTTSYVYGAAIQRSRDLENWTPVDRGPSYRDADPGTLSQIWKLHTRGSRFYAGVADAGLFQSDDGGSTWDPVDGLNHHVSRKKWQPGAGGLCCHAIHVGDTPDDPIACGISAVGLFRSEDGGEQWVPSNDGVRQILADDEFPDIGYCVHAVEVDPDDPKRVVRQEHTGMFRSSDGGATWDACENGLPSTFGFPLGLDHDSKALFSVPLQSDEYRLPIDGRLTVYRSLDRGDSWEPCTSGLPQEHFYSGVLRGSMSIDHRSDLGVYIGTTAGTVHWSRDGGDSWNTVNAVLPRILCVEFFDA